jgi:uncharacterized tellurite resistance protein B-like protein
MASERLVVTLGKVLIATAWADNEVAQSEINCLKDLLFKIPKLNGRQWSRFQIYLETPVGPEERTRLLKDLRDAISSPADKGFCLNVLHDVCEADGVFSDQERAVLDEISRSIANAPTGLFGAMSKLLDGALARRSEALANAPNREEYFEDFVRNKIYYRLCRRLELDEGAVEIDEGDLRKLCAAAGLMAQIAHSDDHIADEEVAAIRKALSKGWDLSDQQATLVAEIAVTEIGAGMDLHRLTREFFEATDPEERSRFIEALFDVAGSHEGTSHEEIEAVRSIAKMLLVSHKDFIRAKLKDEPN